MIITPATISALNGDFKGQFQKAFNAAKPRYAEIATEIPSTSAFNLYGFIDEFPVIREWLGDRVLQGLEAKDLTIVNRDFEGTVVMRRNDVEDDKLGLWGTKTEMLAQQAALHPDSLVVDALLGGFTKKGYDGVNFFAANHVWKEKQFNNLLNLQLDPDNFQTALQLLIENAGGPDSPIIGTDFEVTLIHGPALMGTVKALLLREFGEFGASNIHLNDAKPFMHPRITGSKWILAITSLPIKPVIYQPRSKPNYTGPTDYPEEMNKRKRMIWGVDFRCEAAAALWQLAVGVNV